MKRDFRLKEDSSSSPAHPSWMMRVMPELIRDEARAICGWAVLIAGALFGFWLTEGTRYHQFTVGVLMSSVTLFVSMILLELLWRAIDDGQSQNRIDRESDARGKN